MALKGPADCAFGHAHGSDLRKDAPRSSTRTGANVWPKILALCAKSNAVSEGRA